MNRDAFSHFRVVFTWFLVCSLTVLSGCSPAQSKPDQRLISLLSSASMGNAEAQFKLGRHYDAYNRDPDKAEHWYLEAAKQGHAEAQNSIGSMYQDDDKYEEALKWYQKAADQGHVMATNNLAYLYDLGLGVPENKQKAYDLYMRAAELGSARAMFNIGVMHGSGQLGEKDLELACIWTIRSYNHAQEYRLKLQIERHINYCKNEFPPGEYTSLEKESQTWEPGSSTN